MELSHAEIWAIVGVVMMVVEIFAVSFFFLFIGVGALVTAALTWFGITDNLTTQLVVFSIVSAASMLVFRKKLRESFDGKGDDYNEFKGERATVITTILPRGEGKVFFRGADWIAFTDDVTEIPVNSNVAIKRADGIRLLVEKV